MHVHKVLSANTEQFFCENKSLSVYLFLHSFWADSCCSNCINTLLEFPLPSHLIGHNFHLLIEWRNLSRIQNKKNNNFLLTIIVIILFCILFSSKLIFTSLGVQFSSRNVPLKYTLQYEMCFLLVPQVDCFCFCFWHCDTIRLFSQVYVLSVLIKNLIWRAWCLQAWFVTS